VNRAQRRLLAAVLTACFLGIGLHLNALRETTAPADGPDFYVEQPSWQVFDRTGRLSRQLEARRLVHESGDARARLVHPRLVLTDGTQHHWRADADAGWLGSDPPALVLEGNVDLRPKSGQNGPVVHTEKLRIDDKDDVIQTDQPVALESGGWHFTAAGLHAELGGQQLQLLGNVRGTHD
jgi:LPS export ABC transporter protein LptC